MELKITVTPENLIAIADVLQKELELIIEDSIKATAEEVKEAWIEAVRQARGIWLEERNAYMASINVRRQSYSDYIVETDLPAADLIENGRPARDLKQMLHSSMKVRQNKEGQRYLIIPFRHNVPTKNKVSDYAPQMPKAIYNQVRRKSFIKSSVLEMGTRLSGTGAYDIKTQKLLTVPQAKYSWGSRLRTGDPTSRYEGMVRFNTTTGKSKGSSAYLTFRVMSENSNGWIVPAKPGLFLAKKIQDQVQPMLEAHFTD